jgi:hypothetical protein
MEKTPPNYWVMPPGSGARLNRMNFQKHKLEKILENFDPNLTETENLQMNNYSRIWDCGQLKFIWRRPNK